MDIHSGLQDEIAGIESSLPAGLFHGKSGLAIYFYLLSEVDKNPLLSDKGFDILLDVNSTISSVTDYSFDEGLAGIGWTIEWLIQNSFITDVNSDEILGSIDDTLYKSIMYAEDDNLGLPDGTLGKLVYFLARYSNQSNNSSRYVKLSIKECLVMLTDDIHLKLLSEDGVLFKEVISVRDIVDIGNLLIILSDLLTSRINESIVEKIVYKMVGLIKKIITSNLIVKNYTVQLINYLKTCLKIVGSKLNQQIWLLSNPNFGALERFSISSAIDDDSLLQFYAHSLNLYFSTPAVGSNANSYSGLYAEQGLSISNTSTFNKALLADCLIRSTQFRNCYTEVLLLG
ncbi:hypothetical protein GCM10028806_09460 [Spirosoma terrae]|uniref:Lanthionine synthetase C family protein n=1 Tax=Spirosoma terrae TaxID=1968276 RepID=A0A6L9L978_9BACT|nr:lanthionine synthetase LanC family protein [Spirosoma terrae]NDU95912.1 hypothetical protein [Spirosoma terrae]